MNIITNFRKVSTRTFSHHIRPNLVDGHVETEGAPGLDVHDALANALFHQGSQVGLLDLDVGDELCGGSEPQRVDELPADVGRGGTEACFFGQQVNKCVVL